MKNVRRVKISKNPIINSPKRNPKTYNPIKERPNINVKYKNKITPATGANNINNVGSKTFESYDENSFLVSKICRRENTDSPFKNSISDIPTIIVQPYISGSNYSSDNITSALNIMNNIYSKNNVKLNILETTSITESKFSNVSYKFTNSITSEMVSKGDEDKVNLFFITDYTDAAYLGNAAGIPGSQGLKGSHNGVLINLSAHKTGGSLNNQLLGETAGHEMGHFLGLFHPSESAGTLFDPIADTPQCPLSQNSNNDSKLTAEECGQQYGADNLMFWDSWENGNQDNLTEGQVYVLKRALIAK